MELIAPVDVFEINNPSAEKAQSVSAKIYSSKLCLVLYIIFDEKFYF